MSGGFNNDVGDFLFQRLPFKRETEKETESQTNRREVECVKESAGEGT